MAQTDSSSLPPVPPPKRSGISGNKQLLSILLSVLIINVGIIHTMVTVSTTTEVYAKTTAEVKHETAALSAATSVTEQNATEELIASPEDQQQPVITTYTVKNGDTLSGIAEKFAISTNTIRWANDLTSKSVIKPGDELVILPVTGIEYTVKKGDTLSGIAVKLDASQSEILDYNDIDATLIKPGMKLIVPEAEPIATAEVEKVSVKKAAPEKTPIQTPTKAPAKTIAKEAATSPVKVVATTVTDSAVTVEKKVAKTVTSTVKTVAKAAVKFTNPVAGAVLTQGVHDGNAVDFGVPIGTTVHATAAGTVIISKPTGYNGGYGTYIVINHPDGSQTLYGHLSKVLVTVGTSVTQGQAIGLSGNTGESTGPHLHYKEMGTGAKNTFAKFKVGTRF